MKEIFIAGVVAGIPRTAGITASCACTALAGIVARAEQAIFASCSGFRAGIPGFIALIVARIASGTRIARTTTDSCSTNIGYCAKKTVVARGDISLGEALPASVTNFVGTDIPVGGAYRPSRLESTI
tara:strand:- start:113 stop:493 length:381 start_codon:yes stop_codon:yes gene_type:complete